MIRPLYPSEKKVAEYEQEPLEILMKHQNSFVLYGSDCSTSYMGESFQDYSWIQDFEDDFPQKVILEMLN